jgi:hypothetical protein
MDLDPGRLLFILCQFALVEVLIRRKMWENLPVFSTYIAASLMIALLPRHMDDPHWRETWWLAQQAVLLVGLLLVIVEYILWVQPGMRRRECRWMRFGIFGLVVLLLPVCWTEPGWPWFPRVVEIRQYLQIGLLALLTLLELHIVVGEVRTLRVLFLHGLVLIWFVAGQTAVRVLHDGTGMWPMPTEWQPMIGMLAYCNAALCCLAWSFTFMLVPWTRAFSTAPRCVRFAPPGDGFGQ